ncbi:FkbM family methyltransferase [Mesorhizobium sp. CC13]
MIPHRLIRAIQSELPGAKAGKEAVTRSLRRIMRKPHEPEFSIIARLKPEGQSFVDVGANAGQSIESIRLFAPEAALHAFEANSGLARRLDARYQRDREITIHPFGLGRENGRFTLHVPKYRRMVYDGLASMDLQEASSWLNPERVFGFRPDQLTIESMGCEIKPLDSVGLDPCFVKIDVQGLEHDVILGGIETMKRSEPLLLIEAPSDELCKLLADIGFSDIALSGGTVSPGENRSNSANRLFASARRMRALMGAG